MFSSASSSPSCRLWSRPREETWAGQWASLLLMTVLSHLGNGNSKCYNVGNWTFFNMFHQREMKHLQETGSSPAACVIALPQKQVPQKEPLCSLHVYICTQTNSTSKSVFLLWNTASCWEVFVYCTSWPRSWALWLPCCCCVCYLNHS